MVSQLPIREARRMFLLTVVLRLVLSFGALLLVGPRLVHWAPLVVVGMLPVMLVGSMGLVSWLHEDQHGRVLAAALLVDIAVLSFRSVPAIVALLLE